MPFGAGAAHVMALGPIRVEQALDQIVKDVGEVGSQARRLAAGE